MKTRNEKRDIILLLLYFFRREIRSGNKRPAVAAVKGRLTTCDIFIGPDSLNNRQFPEPAKGFEPSTSVVVLRGWMKTARSAKWTGEKTFLIYTLHYIIFIFYNYALLWFVY